MQRVFLLRHAQRCDEAPESSARPPVPGLEHLTGLNYLKHPTSAARLPTAIRQDPPLTLLGHRQSALATSQIATTLAHNYSFTEVRTSPFLRCVQTAIPLATALSAPLVADAALAQAALSFRRGIESANHPPLHPEPVLRVVAGNVPLAVAPRPPSSLTATSFLPHLEAMADGVAARQAADGQLPEALLCVTHRESIRALERICGVEKRLATPYCALHEYDFDVERRKWSLVHDSLVYRRDERAGNRETDREFAYGVVRELDSAALSS